MRGLAALLMLSVAACGHAQPRRLAVSDDGRAAIAGGQSWRAPQGFALAEREDGLHVISRIPGALFDFIVPLDADGRPSLPANAPFAVRDGVLVLRDRPLAPAAHLVETGQLYPHDEHYHLTHHWENADWRALYRAREEDSGLRAATRQAAAYALATLLDRRIPGATEEALVDGLRRMTETVARARRAVEAQLPSKQLMAMVVHDFEIADDGASLSVEGKVLRAAAGVRFTYCGDHFHVEDARGTWAHVVPLNDVEAGGFELPPSVFFEVSGGTVAPRAGDPPWRRLLARGEIRLGGDRWYVTESFAHPSFQRLKAAALDEATPPAVREAARRSVFELLKLPLDVESDAAFEARLAAIGGASDGRWRELEGKLPARRR